MTQIISKEAFEKHVKNTRKIRNLQEVIVENTYNEQQKKMADLIANMIRNHFLKYTVEITGVEL